MGRIKRHMPPECTLQYPGKEPEADVLGSTAGAFFPGDGWGAPESGASNMLILGDNLPVLKTLVRLKADKEMEGVRLIYIDPPFSTNMRFRTKAGRPAYDDRITGAVFLEFLRKRLILMRELLTEDGAIFVHLDWKKAHHVKVMMDEVFGEENFLNDIIWSYGGRGAKAVSGRFSRNHDIILWYCKGRKYTFNRAFTQRRYKKGENGFKMDDEGRWFKTSPRGDYTDDSVARLEKEGRVHRTRNGVVRIKYFLREEGDWLIEDRLVGDVWDDVPDGMHLSASEKTGYPTQKPERLLERIISSASNPGDVVLDAFCGSGTTLAVAEKLGRRWIGIDSGVLSFKTAQKRLLRIACAKGYDGVKADTKGLIPFRVRRAGAGRGRDAK